MQCTQCGTELASGTNFCPECGAAVERPMLVIEAGPARGERVALQGVTRLGRDPGNDVVLTGEGVSPFHAQIAPDGGGWTLQDLGGASGTIVNGERVVGSTDLDPGDRIVIGGSVIVFDAGSEVAEPPPTTAVEPPAPPTPSAAAPPATLPSTPPAASKGWFAGKSFWFKAAVGVALLSVVGCLALCALGAITQDWDPGETTQPEVTSDDAQPDAATDDTQLDLNRHVSSDQRAVLDVKGPPEAFTAYLDPITGSILEEWTYFTSGEEIIFSNGRYEGGVDVPPPEIDESASIPMPAAYPWQILQDPTPEGVVSLAGPALFRTSAFVLPGWDDGFRVARLWTLAGGGNMITVDGDLAMASIDPGVAIDEEVLQVSELFVGTLGEGEDRLGAILSPGDEPGTYRLSLSPRGQGTTESGTEVVFDLESSSLEGSYALGTDAAASVAALDGSERRAQASGTVTITDVGDTCRVSVDAEVDGRALVVSGRMRSGLWTATDAAGNGG
jgi:hypothetical protein